MPSKRARRQQSPSSETTDVEKKSQKPLTAHRQIEEVALIKSKYDSLIKK